MEMLTTMITPYREDGSVDCETAEKYVEWYYNAGLDVIFAICQSSEIFFLSLEALSAKYHMMLCGMKTATDFPENYLGI